MPEPAAGCYDPSYFEALARIEQRHFWFRARNRVITAAARRATVGLPPGFRVLEIGCGTGQALPALAAGCRGGRVVGMDLFEEGLAIARRGGQPLLRADLRRPPFAAPFSVVAALDVIEHLPDDVGALVAVRGMMVRGGTLLVTVPAHPRLWSYFDEQARHCRRYTAGQLRTAIEDAGFEIVQLTPYMAALLPLMRIARWFGSRRARGSPSGGDGARACVEMDLRIVPGVNELLYAVLSAEAPIIGAGRRLPFGSSLLAVARRP